MAWIGCYEVKLTPACELYEDNLYGAFVNVVVTCESEAEFREKAAEALFEEHYEVIEVTDVRPIDTSSAGLELIDSDLLWEQIADGHLIAFGHFHTFPKSGLDA